MKKDFNPLKLDSGETVFFKRQLEHIKTGAYDKKYKELKATMLFPVSTEASPGARTITFRSFSKVGLAKIVSDYANDFPRVDVYAEEKTANVRSIGESYGYSIQEIRESQMAGTNLDSRRASAARRTNDEKVNDIAFNGDDDYGLQGFINYPGITEYTIPNGAGGDEEWSTKTPDEIVADVSGIITAVIDLTNGREVPDTLLLPIAQYNILINVRMTDGDSNNILNFIMKNNPYLSSIEWVTEMKGAGVGGADRMMVYPRDPEHVTLEIPQPFEQLAAQQKGMEFVIPCHSRCGGIIVYYPLAVAYGDNI